MNFKMGKRSKLTLKDIQMTSIWKDTQHHLSLGNYKYKTITGYHYTPIRMPKPQSTDNTNCWWGHRGPRTLTHCQWKCKMVQLLCKTVWQFLIRLNSLTTWLSICTLWYFPKWVENTCPHKYLHVNIYSSFIHNGQKWSNQHVLW